MLADHLTLSELISHNINTLPEAIELLEFTRDENGLYFYDAGHAEPWEACEGTLRQEIQTMERFQSRISLDGNEKDLRYYHEIRIGSQAYNLILADVMARPGYVPIAERPVPQWKIDFRNGNVETLERALSELELSERGDGTFFYDGDDDDANILINEAYCKKELARLEDSDIESDEGIDFYPFHNIRRWKQAYRIVLAEIEKREASNS